METCKLFAREISRIALKNGLDLNKPEGYVKLTMPGMIPLVINKLGRNMIAVAHNYVENGDVIADPDVLFCMYDGGWVPVEITQREFMLFGRVMGGYRRVAELDRNGCIASFKLRGMKEVADFCRTWARNIRDQGWYARGVKEA